MPVNVEIKAKARDFAQLQALAATLSGTPGTLLYQEDTFFDTPRGRLKLRVLSAAHGELIYYEREDASGPKPSHYMVTPTPDPEALKATLAAALGVCGMVRKRRWLYMVGQIRVHLDDVEGLGTFVELEWVMRPDQTVAEGARDVAALMQQLHIAEADLITGAYVDALTSPPAQGNTEATPNSGEAAPGY
jgi:adenylate cyclase class IV